jgi:hypothetical protein
MANSGIMNSGSSPRLLQDGANGSKSNKAAVQSTSKPAVGLTLQCGTCGASMKTSGVKAHMASHVTILPTPKM